MADERPFVNLNAYLRNSGYHEAAWRVSGTDPAAVLTAGYWAGLARTAERGVLDAIFLPDSPGVPEFRAEYLPGAWFDPLLLLASVAAATEQVGLVSTVSTTYNAPWDVARRLATLDHLSGGRAGWNIVTTVEPVAAANFGDQPHPPREDRYARADEFVDVVLKLWDSWEDDAALLSRESGRWADGAKLHPPHHRGERFSVAGLLPFPRSPQGYPLLTQAGSSPAGVALAAKYAEGVFTPQPDLDTAVAARAELRRQAAANGRDPGHVRILPGLPYLLGSTEAEAKQRRAELEDSANGEFRWRNTANLAGLDHRELDPDRPLPEELLNSTPRTTFGGSIYRIAREHPGTFREVAARVSALPGAVDFTGTPEGLAELIEQWFRAGAADGFTVMPHVLPEQLDLFVDHVVPILQRRGIARTEYTGRTLREHVGLPRPDRRAGTS